MAPPDSSPRWLFGPFLDLFFGCGLMYCVVFGALAVAGPEVRRFLPPALMPLVLLVSGIPHYGATLLRVYERREDRRKYVAFAGLATAVVWVALAVGAHALTVGSLLITVYLTWSPWHYSSQNYGIALMFLRRRGVEVSPLAKRLFQLSFALSFFLTFLAFHGAEGEVAYAPGAPGTEYQRSVYGILRLGIPQSVVHVLAPATLVGTVVCLVAGLLLLRRGGTWRDIFPAAVLAFSQALWFTLPLTARHAGFWQGVEPLGTEQATYVFLWIAVAHATQYVWVTCYFQKRSPSARSQPRYLARILLAGAAIWVVPALVFAPGLFGTVPYDAGLGLLVASAVNIHHFILDGVIWKLRDGRIAQILLRGGRQEAPAERERPTSVWLPRAGWAAGALGVVVLTTAPLEREFGLNPAARAKDPDVDRLEASVRRLTWLGRDSGVARVMLAMSQAAAGNSASALEHAEIARQMTADHLTMANLAVFYQRTGRGAEAIEPQRRASGLRPESIELKNRLAWLIAKYGDPTDAAEAVTLAEEVAVATRRRNPDYLATLALAYGSAERFTEAVRAASEGLALARAQGRRNLATNLTGLLTEYRRALEGR